MNVGFPRLAQLLASHGSWLQLKLDVLLGAVIRACRARGEYAILVIDEANKALAVAGCCRKGAGMLCPRLQLCHSRPRHAFSTVRSSSLSGAVVVGGKVDLFLAKFVELAPVAFRLTETCINRLS